MNHEQPRRKLRRDAAANRERILTHAAAVIAAEGIGTSLHRLADDLGLGIGTVYRHFPTQDDLYLAIYERYWERADASYAARVTPGLDAWGRVIAYVDTAIEVVFGYPAGRLVTPRVQRVFPHLVRTSAWTESIVEAVGIARSEGLIRADLDASDIAVMPFLVGELAAVPCAPPSWSGCARSSSTPCVRPTPSARRCRRRPSRSRPFWPCRTRTARAPERDGPGVRTPSRARRRGR